jgi:hypothetical protein
MSLTRSSFKRRLPSISRAVHPVVAQTLPLSLRTNYILGRGCAVYSYPALFLAWRGGRPQRSFSVPSGQAFEADVPQDLTENNVSLVFVAHVSRSSSLLSLTFMQPATYPTATAPESAREEENREMDGDGAIDEAAERSGWPRGSGGGLPRGPPPVPEIDIPRDRVEVHFSRSSGPVRVNPQ